MDEQRSQAYRDLIEELLSCSPGKEAEVLQSNVELLDRGLLAAIVAVAEEMESQGQGISSWLRQLAAQLAPMLTTKPLSNASDARQFCLENFQLIAKMRGNPHQIYPIWAQNQARFNQDMLAELPTVATQLRERSSPEQKRELADVLAFFGTLINQFPLATRWINLELGITAYRQALTIRTQAAMPAAWAEVMNNLANAYVERICGDASENIEQALNAYQQALTVRTPVTMPIDWANTMNNLAIAYADRIKGDRAENIEKAIEAYQQALKVITRFATPIDWANTMSNLATAYKNRVKGNRAENIEQAIDIYRQSLSVRTKEVMPIEWASTTNSLATAYVDRIKGDRAENIEQAISCFQQALLVRTKETMPLDWAATMMNVAVAYRSRIRGDRAKNIESAIEAYQQALAVTTQEAMPFEWAETMMNLASAYYFRIEGDRAENIEQAVSAYQQALSIMTQRDRPLAWARALNNLATAYRKRIKGDRAENTKIAIESYQAVFSVIKRETMPVDWATTMTNLADAYASRIQDDPANGENIEHAISTYQQALSVFGPELLPDDCRKTARKLGDLYSSQQNWQAAVDTYTQALQATENLYKSATLLYSQNFILSENLDLYRCAAYAYARCGDMQKAVEIIEQGRARSLSESLDRDRTDISNLQKAYPELYAQYISLAQQLRTLENVQRDQATSIEWQNLTPATLRESAATLQKQIDDATQSICKVPGYETFLALPTFAQVRHSIEYEQPLVYLIATPNGSLALVLDKREIHSVWLDRFADNLFQEIRLGLYKKSELGYWLTAYQDFCRNATANYSDWCEAIDDITRQMWPSLIYPLIQTLKNLNHSRAILISTGFLGFLPLHAVWTPDPTAPTGRRYVLDDIHFTYAPNAKSLVAARTITQQHSSASSILAIDNPGQDLPNSEKEVSAAISSFSERILLGHTEATVAAVQEQLLGKAIAHFSCHGTANPTNPLNSGLVMCDGLLTLKDILALDLSEQGGLRLAVLSACDTSIQGIENADEVISLPTGLLQAGVAAVISSLWSVSDLSSMLLLTRFYDFWRTEDLEISQALRQAQQWVRDTKNQQKYDYLKITFQKIAGHQLMSQQAVDELLREFMLQYIYPDGPQARSFAHPFHWAAFTYTGV